MTIKKRWLFILFFIVQGTAIFLTYSRLAWAVLALFMVLILVFTASHHRRTLFLSYIIFFLICLSFFIYHNKSDSSKTRRVINSISIGKSNLFRSRSIIYKTGYKMLAESPLFGFGAGTFSYHYLDYQGKVAQELGRGASKYQYLDLEHAHSDFIEIGIESGYIGLSLFVILLLYLVFRGMIFLKGDPHYDLKYICMIPLLFIPFGIWAFPFHLPFSKAVFLFSLAYISYQNK
ncbi:O-antigen ligase family protein, partial [Spirochaetota bacterium]